MDDGCVATLLPNNHQHSSSDYQCAKKAVLTYGEESCNNVAPSANRSVDPNGRYLLKCGICSDVFLTIHELSNHLKHCHYEIKAYDCGICLKFFPFHDELETHLLEGHLQSDKGPAMLIGSTNISVAEIENFMRNHEMRERVELECPFCAIVLNKLSTYQLHMSISHRGKAWDKDGLCSAVLKVTTISSKSLPPVISEDDPGRPAPGRVYSCSRCDKKVFGREPMKRHAATHRAASIIQCRTCHDFFITESSFREHQKKAHLSLLNLNIRENEHGDLFGRNLDDILKANDCLSSVCSVRNRTTSEPCSVVSSGEEISLIDLDKEVHKSVTECSTDLTFHPQLPITFSDNAQREVPRPDWKTHKRERSDDSLPDPDPADPLHNLIILCKTAGKEQKRLAREEEEGCTVPETVLLETSHLETSALETRALEMQKQHMDNLSKWTICVHLMVVTVVSLSSFIIVHGTQKSQKGKV